MGEGPPQTLAGTPRRPAAELRVFLPDPALRAELFLASCGGCRVTRSFQVMAHSPPHTPRVRMPARPPQRVKSPHQTGWKPVTLRTLQPARRPWNSLQAPWQHYARSLSDLEGAQGSSRGSTPAIVAWQPLEQAGLCPAPGGLHQKIFFLSFFFWGAGGDVESDWFLKSGIQGKRSGF